MSGAPVKDCKEIEITSAMIADGVEALSQFDDLVSAGPTSSGLLVEAVARAVLKHVSGSHSTSPARAHQDGAHEQARRETCT